MGVEFKDNSKQVLMAFKSKTGVALNLIGAAAAGYTQDNTPVQTGNLVNHAGWDVSNAEDFVRVGFKQDADPKKNPDYALYVEVGSRNNRPNHMLQKGCSEHTEEFKSIAKKAYKGG